MSRKFVLTSLFSALLAALSSQAGAVLIISEVVDGDLSGGNPKFVEITNTSASDFTFAGGGIVMQSNAATDLVVDVPLTGVTILAGDSYVIQSSANGGQEVFEATYGFAADLYTAAFFSNGDDRYILADADDGAGNATNLVDIHGEIDIDGSGAAWEYLDSYAYRLPGVTTGNGGVFDIAEWFQAGNGALDTLDGPGHVALTTPGTHNFVPEPGTLALGGLGLLGVVASRRRR